MCPVLKLPLQRNSRPVKQQRRRSKKLPKICSVGFKSVILPRVQTSLPTPRCCTAGAGLQGPAGAKTDYPPGDDEPMTLHGDVDLDVGVVDPAEGVVGPSGAPSLLTLTVIFVYLAAQITLGLLRQ